MCGGEECRGTCGSLSRKCKELGRISPHPISTIFWSPKAVTFRMASVSRIGIPRS
jgi:hypothetical protein